MSRLMDRVEGVAFDVLPVPVLVWVMRRRCARRRAQRRAQRSGAGSSAGSGSG